MPPQWKKVGDSLVFIDGNEVERKIVIVNVENARTLATQEGFNLTRDVPVYHLQENFNRYANGAYSNEMDALLFHPGTSETTKRHEIIHAIECKQEVTPELQMFFEKIVALFPDGIEYGDLTFFNYKKNIHEFLADGFTHRYFIAFLKEKGLYEEFLTCTNYLHVLKS